MDPYEWLFVLTAFLIQAVLLVYFVFRKRNFERSVKWGWVVYVMAIPALLVSVILLLAGKPVTFWLGGMLFAAWALLGYLVDLARSVEWRSPILPRVFFPYVTLYLAA